MTKVASCERFPSPVLVEKQQRKTSSSTCYLEPPRALSGRWAAGQAPGTSAQELFRPSRKFRQHFSLTVRKKSGETSGFRFLPYGPSKNRAPNRGPAPGDSLEAVSRNFLGAPKISRAFLLGQVGEICSKIFGQDGQGIKPCWIVCPLVCCP